MSRLKSGEEAPPDLPQGGGDQCAKVKLRVYETAANEFEEGKQGFAKQ